MSRDVVSTTKTLLQTCYKTVLNSFMLPRGTTQQLAAWNTISCTVCCYYVVGVATIVAELGIGIKANYGRFSTVNKKTGIKVPARIAWLLQEFPSFAVATYFLQSSLKESVGVIPIGNRLLLSLFIVHYFNRTFIFSLKIRGGKPTRLLEFVLAAIFTTINGFLQGLCLTKFDEYKITNLYEMRFIIGLILFISGFGINLHCDSILRNLRKPGETGYKIPYGGAFNFVTVGNYFGEFLEWTGFAIAGNNAGGYAFAAFTFANLFPRAVQIHEWYQRNSITIKDIYSIIIMTTELTLYLNNQLLFHHFLDCSGKCVKILVMCLFLTLTDKQRSTVFHFFFFLNVIFIYFIISFKWFH